MQTLLWLTVAFAALPLLGVLYQWIGTWRDARKFPPPGRLVNGLHICEMGREMGAGNPTVLFESGIAASTVNWSVVQTAVSVFTRTVSYDRAGFGWSDAARTPRHAGTIAEELHALLDKAGIPGPYIFVGHSFGALIGRCYASRWPSEIAGMVLVDPLAAAEWTDIGPEQQNMLDRGASLSRRGGLLARIGVVRFSLNLLMAGAHVIPRVVGRAASGGGLKVADRLVGEVRKMPRELWPVVQAHWSQPKNFESMGEHLRLLPQSAAAVDALTMPADFPVKVLLAADANPVRRREYAVLFGERCVDVANSGHWIQLDQPQAVVDAIREMLGT